MATHLYIISWRIPGTEEPGRLQSTGSQRVGHNLATMQQQRAKLVRPHLRSADRNKYLWRTLADLALLFAHFFQLVRNGYTEKEFSGKWRGRGMEDGEREKEGRGGEGQGTSPQGCAQGRKYVAAAASF